MQQEKTRYISDESQVPSGWVPMAQLAPSDKALRRALTDAHRDGRVDAVKLVRRKGDVKTGRVWMDPDQATAFIAAYRGVQRPATQLDQADELVSSLSRDIGELRAAIENLQAAIELYGAAK